MLTGILLRLPRTCQDANVEPINAADPAIARIARGVRASMDDLVAAAVREIWDQVPAYPGSNDPQLRADVTGHVRGSRSRVPVSTPVRW